MNNKTKSLSDIFRYKPSEYKNNINHIKDYFDVTGEVVSLMTGVKNAKEKIKNYIKENKLYRNPKVKFWERDLKGNRDIKIDTLVNYIRAPKKNGNIMVPSFTVYFSRKKKESLHAEFININVKSRSMHKKLAFKYRQEKDYDKFNYHNVIQKVKKIFNNSLSGAYASMGTVLNNASAHYTLTSMTRTISSIGNAISESIISGNRHYRNPDITFNHVATIVSSMDYDKVKKVLIDFNIHTPTPNELLLSILKSTAKYWRDVEKEEVLLNYFTKLDGYQRAYILYHNDLYHLREFNDKLVRTMVTDIIKYKVLNITEDECGSIIKTSEEWLYNLSVHVVSHLIIGKKPDDFTLLDKQNIASFMINIRKVLFRYEPMLKTFLVTDIFPASMAYFKEMVREAIVLSDTDSTCATYRNWVVWFYDEDKFTDDAVSLTATIMTITTQTVDHYIKAFAVNMNILYKDAHHLAMKNEFFWKVFVNTNVSKHYFAGVVIQEGNVLDHTEKPLKALEKKGVNLIAPNAFGPMRVLGDELQLDIINKVSNNEKIELGYYLNKILEGERLIFNKVKEGSPDVLKLEKIKSPTSYKLGPDKSPYFHHTLWSNVFELQYGKAPDPQYMAVKVPTTLTSKRLMSEWLDGIADDYIATNLRKTLGTAGKDHIAIFRFPLIIVYNKGLPDIIHEILDYKRIIRDNCGHLYMILESLGYYVKDGSCLLNELEDYNL